MRVAIALVVTLAVGLVIGRYVWGPAGTEGAASDVTERTASETAAAVDEPARQAAEVRWRMPSAFPGELTQLGTLGRRFERLIDTVSEGRIQIRFFEPGALVPALEIFDAVSNGAVDSGWSSPGYWAGKVSALQFFTAVPFGPEPGEYMAWLYFGGGHELFRKIYADYNIYPIHCGMISPEGSGWFREPIESLEDFQGMKMRFFGLGAKVVEKLGVSTQLLAGGDIYPALELGTIDATEFSMPAVDLDVGFHQIAKHYYLPGWHQPASLIELIVNRDRWEALRPPQQRLIEMACGDSMRHGIAEGEALQFQALRELQAKGVTLHRWPESFLDAFESAWQEVVAEEAAADPQFAEVWESLSNFREQYALWRQYGYLD